MQKNVLKEASILLIAAILVSTTIFVFTPLTKVAKADTVTYSYDFSDWPPEGWTRFGYTQSYTNNAG